MTRPFWTLILLCSAGWVNAQSWCAPGATWTYTNTNNWTFDGIARYAYVGDTIMAGGSAQIITLHSEGHFWPLDTIIVSDGQRFFTRIEGDRIDLWTGAEFDTLYDFAASPGDHWFVNAPDGVEPFLVMTVQDTGHVLIDGAQLRYLTTTDGDTVVERLGSLYYHFVPWSQLVLDASDGPLRCYNDVEIDYFSPTWWFGCASITGMDASTNRPTMALPNPGTNQLTLSLPAGAHRFALLDTLGHTVLEQRGNGERITIDTSALPMGLYLVRVDQATSVVRWIKE